MFETVTLDTLENALNRYGIGFFKDFKFTKHYNSRLEKYESISCSMRGDLKEEYSNIKKSFRPEFDPYAEYQDRSYRVNLYLKDCVRDLLLNIAKELLPAHKEFNISHLYETNSERDSFGICVEHNQGNIVEKVYVEVTGFYDSNNRHNDFGIYVGKKTMFK